MRIGIDIDNVISNMNECLIEEYLKHDKTLRNTGIVNSKARIRYGMFDWTKSEDDEFYYSNIERMAENFGLIPSSRETIERLKQEGNEIYIITGRDNGEYKEPWGLTIDWLKKHNVYYDKLILTDAYNSHAKTVECMKYNIDIMIDDNIATCLDIQKHGIKVLAMNTTTNMTEDDIERVNDWREIYEKISNTYNCNRGKLNVILDTDPCNECDDQFALSYLLKCQDRFNIEAITIAPYSKANVLTIPQGIEKSFSEIEKICKWLNFDDHNKVFRGSESYLKDCDSDSNEAVEKIIEVCLKNEKTYILAIGAITNIALAIIKEPKIIGKIEVIWLGGHSFLNKDNMETNFKQDVQAVKTVFESKVKVTIIPAKNVASNLVTSVYELEHCLKDKSELCNYLISRFCNDGLHGLKTRRVLWDVSAVAYLLNRDWFETKNISCPSIKDDTSYEITENNHTITMVNYMDVDKIYEDLFKKLGEI